MKRTNRNRIKYVIKRNQLKRKGKLLTAQHVEYQRTASFITSSHILQWYENKIRFDLQTIK